MTRELRSRSSRALEIPDAEWLRNFETNALTAARLTLPGLPLTSATMGDALRVDRGYVDGILP
ncbi:MAG: hypothetical protein PIR02_10310 [Microbacterium enclense]